MALQTPPTQVDSSDHGGKLALRFSLMIGIGTIVLLAIFAGLSLQFSSLNILTIGVSLVLAIGFGFFCGSSIKAQLQKQRADISVQLQIINETLPLISAKRYEKVSEQLSSLDDGVFTPEIASIREHLIHIASTATKVDEQAAKRVRESFTESDQLRHQLAHLNELINNAQMLIMTVNAKHEVRFFNKYASDVTGTKPEDITGIGVGNLLSSTDWNETKHYYDSLLAGNIKMANQETEIIDGDGHLRNIWWLHSMLDGDPENPIILSVGHDVSEDKDVEKRVVWLSTHDALTGLMSAAKFQEIFVESLNQAQRYDKHNTLLYLHIDFPLYQKIDNHLTQQMMDEMRVSVADALNQLIRQTDTLARINEHDFAILQFETTDEGRQRFTEKILHRIDELKLITPKKHLPISAHIGVIDYPYESSDASELFAFAELAAVRAKHHNSKSSGYHVFEPSEETASDLKQRVFWKKRIQKAIEDEKFVVHYQPIVALGTTKTVGYEGFLRLLDEATGEAIPAGKFIEIAEKQELIEQIDKLVLKQVFSSAAANRDTARQQYFAINLSRSSLEPNKLLPMLKKLLTHYKLSGRQIVLEVSEDMAVNETDTLKLLMTAVKQLEVRVAIDDFGFDGTLSKYGFSSFSLLQQLPVDFVKINARFIRDLINNSHDQLFVKSLAEEARLRGVKTIAAGVESDEVMTLLQSYGIDYAQGYFIGHPSASLESNH